MLACSRLVFAYLSKIRGGSCCYAGSLIPALVLVLSLACPMAITVPAASQQTSGQALSRLQNFQPKADRKSWWSVPAWKRK